MSINVVTRYLGDPNTPKEIRWRRRTVYDACRRLGTPFLIKRLLTTQDEANGFAAKSPNFLDGYGQVRANDPLSHGSGYVSVQASTTEWLDANGNVVPATASQPPAGFTAAPQYRGYGPGYLTYCLVPDAPEDLIKIDATGALIKLQPQAMVQAPWYPPINDGDLLIAVQLGPNGQIAQINERYQAHQCQPITMRGRDRRGRRQDAKDLGNRYAITQGFQMNRLPDNHPLSFVDTDR